MGSSLALVGLPTGLTALQISCGQNFACALMSDRNVYCWGGGGYYQLGTGLQPLSGNSPPTQRVLLPSALGQVASVSCGHYFCCVLMTNAGITCWGRNNMGQVGIGTALTVGASMATLQLVQLPTGEVATSISMGSQHSCALLKSGSIACWGDNTKGQLGIGTTATVGNLAGQMGTALVLAKLPTGAKAIAISCSLQATCAILNDGRAACWGYNTNGALGIGTATDVGTTLATVGSSMQNMMLPCGLPGAYSAGGTTCSVCSAGSYSTAAFAASATTCQSCGAGTYSQSGAATCLSCTAGYYCAGMSDRTPCTAGTYSTALGATAAGTCSNQCAAGSYSPSGSSACTLCAAGTFSTASAGTAVATCVSCAAGFYSTALGATYAATCASCTAGTYSATLGATAAATCLNCAAGTYSTALAATAVATCVQCAAGIYSAAGASVCLSCTAGTYSPAAASSACLNCSSGTWSTAGSSSTCSNSCAAGRYTNTEGATAADACLLCPVGSFGVEAGAGCASCGIFGVVDMGIPTGYAYHLCAVFTGGTRMACWGDNPKNELGVGDITNRGASSATAGDNMALVLLPSNTIVVSASNGLYFTCILTSTGRVGCWGENINGALGLGSTLAAQLGNALVYASMPTGTRVVALSCGQSSSCALLNDRRVVCWGNNADGRLGIGSIVGANAKIGDAAGEMGDALQAVQMPSGTYAVGISCGDTTACALLNNGSVACWGGDLYGNLGTGSAASRGDNPDELGEKFLLTKLPTNTKAVAVAAAQKHICVLLDNGKIACFGYNSEGQLGTGDLTNRGLLASQVGDSTALVLLPTGTKAVSLALADAHTCALLDNGKAYCWGRNLEGQLGIGSATSVTTAALMGNSLQPVLLPTGSTVLKMIASFRKTCALILRAGQKQMVCWGLNQNVNMGGGNLGIGNVNAVGTNTASMGDSLVAVQFPANVETTYATALGATACSTTCLAGSYSGYGLSPCALCGAGTYSLAGARSCTNCGAGTFSDASAATAVATCVSCGAGTYSGVAAAAACVVCASCSTNAIATQTCAAGSTSDTTACVCSTGYTGNGFTCGGASAACAPGTYPSAVGSTACLSCQLGTFSTASGATDASTCLPCGAGTYTNTTASTGCLQCAAGTYSTGLGYSTACAPCLANSFCRLAATTPEPCPPHTWSAPGASSRLDCACDKGFWCKYTKRITMTVTLNCTLGDFNNNVGNVRTEMIAAIAAAANVAPSQVVINGLLPHSLARHRGGDRRVSVTVSGATDMKKLQKCRAVAAYEWREAHGVRAITSNRGQKV